ncbi:MAG: hypothetical protein QXN37_03420 [Candidatus Anstonellaceae archaeon]
MFCKHKQSNFFVEQDASLQERFKEAGFGIQHEGSTLFHPLEVAYLVGKDKSSIQGLSFKEFIQLQSKKDKKFEFAFAVYSHIRGTGRQVRLFSKGIKYFRVYAAGVGREEERPSHLVCLIPGKAPSLKSLENEIKVAHLARLDLIVAFGTPANLKFYKISSYNF